MRHPYAPVAFIAFARLWSMPYDKDVAGIVRRHRAAAIELEMLGRHALLLLESRPFLVHARVLHSLCPGLTRAVPGQVHAIVSSQRDVLSAHRPHRHGAGGDRIDLDGLGETLVPGGHANIK